MEVSFYIDRHWKNCGRPYEPLTNHKIIKNVLIESENSGERYDLMIDLLTQMERSLPPFSTLYINLNPKVECPEMFNTNFTYGSPEFNVPYNLKSGDGLYDTFIRCFTAILDFHPELRVITGIIYQDCEESGFPTSIIGFLDLIRTFLQDHRYDDEFTNSLLKNIKDARDLFENDSTLEQTIRIGSKIPEWVALWKKKQKIWIDLSSCKPHIQRMLIPVIFQNLLRATEPYGAPEDYWLLNGVVMINDSAKVFTTVPWELYTAHYNQKKNHWKYLIEKYWLLTKEQIIEGYGDPLFLFKTQLEKYYRKLLFDEFRFRNITLFTGTRDENNIYNFISSLSQVKFVPGEKRFL